MLQLRDYLEESILDMDSVIDNIDSNLMDDWFKNYVKGSYKVKKLRNNTYQIQGSINITKYYENEFPNIFISKVTGNVYIEDCNVQSLKGLFSEGCEIKGTLSITNCNQITDLQYAPESIKNLSITSCSKFKSLDGVPRFIDTISIMKCGKKFTKNQIQKSVSFVQNIFCSMEEENEGVYLNESLMDPILLRAMDQYKKSHIQVKLSNLFNQFLLQLDKITPSMRETYSISSEKEQLFKCLRKIYAKPSAASKNYGVVFFEDSFGNFFQIVDAYGYIYRLKVDINTHKLVPNQPFEYSTLIKSYNQLLDRIENPTKYLYGEMLDLKYVHVFNITNMKDLSTADIITQRSKAKQGVIDMSKEGLKQYWRAQQERYKLAIKQLKSIRNSDQYKNTANQVANIMDRFTKFMQKLINDPKWASNIPEFAKYDIFNTIQSSPTVSSKSPYRSPGGLIYNFQYWSDYVVKQQLGVKTYGNIENYAKDLQNNIRDADRALQRVGL